MQPLPTEMEAPAVTAPMTPQTVETAGLTTVPPGSPAVPPATSKLTDVTHLLLGITAYIPTFWALFNLPNAREPVAVAVVVCLAVTLGPIVTVVLAVLHMKRNTAHESRLQEIEQDAIATYRLVAKEVDPKTVWQDIRKILQAIHGSTPAGS